MFKTLPAIALISEFTPPHAGMTVLADETLSNFIGEGYRIIGIRTNPEFPKKFNWIDKIKLIRGILKWCRFLFSLRKTKTVDLIHIFSSSGLNYFLFTVPVILASKFYRKKLIIHFHGGGAYSFFKTRRRLLAWSFEKSDSFVVPSRFLENEFGNLGFVPRVIGNFVSIDRFNFISEFKIPIVILSIRNLTSVYNIECAIRAFKLVADKFPEAILRIVGDGDQRKYLENLVAELSLLDKIEFLGNIDNSKIPGLLEEASVLVNTPRIDNTPVSLLEAFSAGVPVVSTSVGGIPYMIDDGVNGILAEQGNYESVCEGILKLLSDQELSRSIIINAKKYVDQYCWENISKQWNDEYSRVMSCN